MDRRLAASNGRVADEALRGKVDAEDFVVPIPHLVKSPTADLLGNPNGTRDRQLLFGEQFDVLEQRDDWCFGRSQRDGYVGYLKAETLCQLTYTPTHFVAVAATHLYSAPDLKSPELIALSHLSKLQVAGESEEFLKTNEGYVPKLHLQPIGILAKDHVNVAALYLGTPYLWGGNSIWGIDCSGLVQASLLACGIDGPGDSDLQEKNLVSRVDADDVPKRGELWFWNGHVAIVVDEETIIHANAHQMAVAFESIPKALSRISDQGGGGLTRRIIL